MNVGVICPVFNASDGLLTAAVRSVLDQAARHSCELILIDDGSTAAETIAALRRIEAAESRVRVVRAGRNMGPGRARNLGIAGAAQDWLGFIDADDLWPPGKLDTAADVHRERPDTRWIAGQFATLGPDGAAKSSFPIFQKCETAEAKTHSVRLRTPDLTRVLVGDWLHLGTSLVQRSLLAEAGGFDERLRYGEDWLLFLRMSLLSPLDYIRGETYILRRQGASLMHSAGRISKKYARSSEMARRLPELRPFRRELRWFSYRLYKELAMNNLLNRRRASASYFATRAFLLSPNEVAEYGLFWSLLLTRGMDALKRRSARYSASDQVDLAALSPAHLERDDEAARGA